jgi:hypothetical protein
MSVFGLVNLALWLVVVGLEVWAFVDAARRPAAHFKAVGKLEKVVWLLILGLLAGASLVVRNPLSIFVVAGAIGSLVYLYGIRPQLQALGGGRGRRSSSDGPYGPW